MTKKRVFDIIQVGNATDIPSRIFDMAFILMVLTNLFIALFETFDASGPYLELLDMLELFTVVCFGVEQRDIVLLQGAVMFVTLAVVLISLAVDLLTAWMNPRIRLGWGGGAE